MIVAAKKNSNDFNFFSNPKDELLTSVFVYSFENPTNHLP